MTARTFAARAGKWTGKALVTTMMWFAHSAIAAAFLGWLTFLGWPETFDLPSPTWKQIIGIGLIVGFVLSAHQPCPTISDEK